MSNLNCRVVLVRTRFAGNIGAIARVMQNFGLSDLVLVDPVADPLSKEALLLATHGETLLRSCRRVADLGAAVGDCVMVAATSARLGGLFRRQAVGTPDAICPLLTARMAQGPVALVFGPEPTGLSNQEISRCHCLIHIPTEPAHPALNLAQSVAICLYEWKRALGQTASASPETEPPAPFADQERMFDALREGLEAIHFLYGTKADSLMHALRHLIGRAGPTPMELELLFGLSRQLRWIADQKKTI